MFKRIGWIAMSLLLLGGYARAGTSDSESPRKDLGSHFGDGVNRNVYVNRVSSSGHMVNETGLGELGSPIYPWLKVYVASGGVTTTNGLTRHHEQWQDLPAKSQSAIYTGTAVSTTTLAGGGTTYVTGDLTQPSIPRNIVILSSTVSNVGQTTMTATATCYVYGVNSVGITTSEYVTLVTTADAAVGRGNVAWAFISSVTVSGFTSGNTSLPEPTVKIFIGTSDKIGLANVLTSTSTTNTSSIYKVNEAGTATTTFASSPLYNTITFVTAGNASNDYDVWYIQNNSTPAP